MASPAVTVVIPTYRRNELLRGALDSVDSQEYAGRITAVVVDNSETRAAESVVDEFAFATYLWQQDSIPRQSTGTANAAASRDLGIAVADGEYVHFLDDDDELKPAAVRRKVEAVQQSEDAEATYNATETVDGSVKLVPDVVAENELAFVLTNIRPPGNPSTLLVRREVLLDCPPTRTLPHGDIAMWVELLLRTPFVYVDEPLTVRQAEPEVAESVSTQEGRLRTYERYVGLRKQLLGKRLQRAAQANYEQIRTYKAELEDESSGRDEG